MTPTSSSPSAGSSRPRTRRCWRSAPGRSHDPPLRRAVWAGDCLDVSEEMLRLGRGNLAGVRNVEWVLGSGVNLDVIPTTGSTTSSPTSTLQHVPRTRRCCATWRRQAGSCGQAGKVRCRCATRSNYRGRSIWPATWCMPPGARVWSATWRGTRLPAHRLLQATSGRGPGSSYDRVAAGICGCCSGADGGSRPCQPHPLHAVAGHDR